MNAHAIRSTDELLAHALAIESGAAQGYADLADQLEVHNNQRVAALFRRMADIEQRHLAQLRALIGERALPHLAPWEYRWSSAEPPEAPDESAVYYLMSEREALELALTHERRAARFYTELAGGARREDVRALARSFQTEEQEHVRLIEQWLQRTDAAAAPEDDPDPPGEAE